jgi:hypothetical protein
MTRAAGMALIALGALLVLPQIVRVCPAQSLIAAGLILAFVGAVAVADDQPRNAGGSDGHA